MKRLIYKENRIRDNTNRELRKITLELKNTEMEEHLYRPS